REKCLVESLQPLRKVGQGTFLAHVETRRNAASPGHSDEVHPALRVARLHAGLAINAIIENNDGEIARLLDADGRQRAKPPEPLAVAGDHGNAPPGLPHPASQSHHPAATPAPPHLEVTLV